MVGQSDRLTDQLLGGAIDEADAIIRVGDAPTLVSLAGWLVCAYGWERQGGGGGAGKVLSLVVRRATSNSSGRVRQCACKGGSAAALRSGQASSAYCMTAYRRTAAAAERLAGRLGKTPPPPLPRYPQTQLRLSGITLSARGAVPQARAAWLPRDGRLPQDDMVREAVLAGGAAAARGGRLRRGHWGAEPVPGVLRRSSSDAPLWPGAAPCLRWHQLPPPSPPGPVPQHALSSHDDQLPEVLRTPVWPPDGSAAGAQVNIYGLSLAGGETVYWKGGRDVDMSRHWQAAEQRCHAVLRCGGEQPRPPSPAASASSLPSTPSLHIRTQGRACTYCGGGQAV